ncbi:MAG TPA: adenylyl-sulfate kinase [Polyangiaceae bacterium]|nr:adenylyl-sulfate kinase [Polyangiaceae bacterium]
MTSAIVWFTGLPSSGKSQLARRVQARLTRECLPCCLLDGDRVRALLHPQPGYSSAERDDFYLTLGGLALELAQQGLVVLVPATANRKQYRDRIRAQAPRFIEVWMTATLDECRLRDAKRLYAQFASGQVSGLPGEDTSYEAPEYADVTASGGEDDDALQRIVRALAAPQRAPRA